MLKRFYLNLSVKYKILILFYAIALVIASALGFYSTSTSEQYVLDKVILANLGVVKQLCINLNLLQKDITDISTYLCTDSDIQAFLKDENRPAGAASDILPDRSNALKFIINIIASKSYISCLILYSNKDVPFYYEFTDMSIGAKMQSSVQSSAVYQAAVKLKGTPLWFPMLEQDNIFIDNSNYPKIGLCRIIRDFSNFKQIGFLVMGINESTLRSMCKNNIQNEQEGMLITDHAGNILSHVGTDFYEEDFSNQKFYQKALSDKEGFLIDTLNEKDYLIVFSTMEENWKAFYAVPMQMIKKEINSVKNYTVLTVIICFLFSFPLVFLTSTLLTAPIQKLLRSMKKFQMGNFDERVEFKYNDEIGQLGKGYNTMVANIKDLIDRAYVLQIKEHEAELNALQAQINPHFLYNTLDTIYWKSQRCGEEEISEMVYSLSRLFRLSLNRGKGFSLISSEKELVEHYLLLQKIRFKNKLDYEINISEEILPYVIPKLTLQPFVENAILHGLDSKEEGGTVIITGRLLEGKILLTVEDDGLGMDRETVKALFEYRQESNINTSFSSGGYAIKNVDERLGLYFNNQYSLKVFSEPDKGTRIEIMIPAFKHIEGEETQR